MRARGFTLIELLIAMTITAFIGVATYAIFYGVVNADERNLKIASQLNDLERVMGVLERDLLQAVPRSIINGYGEAESAFSGQAEALYQTPDDYLLKFTRSGWHNPRERQRSELTRVGYWLQDNTLWRGSWWHIDPADELAPMRAELLTGVTAIRLRYHRPVSTTQGTNQGQPQSGNQWVSQWPDSNTNGVAAASASDALPLAVEIQIELEEWGEIRRLFILPAG